MNGFKSDPFPGKPRILFIGLPENSHTQSWIDLLEGSSFNVRLFSMPTGVPPDAWEIPTYVTTYTHAMLNPRTRRALYPSQPVARLTKRCITRLMLGENSIEALQERWLAKVIRGWRPNIIHTLGIDQGGEFYLQVRRKFKLEHIGKWVLQTRGGSDLSLTQFDPVRREQVADVIRSCDQLISDNSHNFRIARELGAREDQIAPIGPVPGTGGMDVESMRQKWEGSPAHRRLIIWPKAYDSPWAKMLPVLEAIRLCWDRIQPCEIHMLSMFATEMMWYWSLPENIRRSCRAYGRVPRSEVLELMPKARVMLAPSLVDGIPNSMFEAMACGVLPIVSPLETLSTVVSDEQNVLFARNLYPEEIAEALTRAMNDDELVETTAARNVELVARLANRQTIRAKVIEFYESLAG